MPMEQALSPGGRGSTTFWWEVLREDGVWSPGAGELSLFSPTRPPGDGWAQREVEQRQLSKEATRRYLRRAGNHSSSSLAYYFHHHRSLVPTENLWGSGDREIPVNSWNNMDECCNLVWTQVTTTSVVTVHQNCLDLFEYCLCIWQGREGAAEC